MTELFWTDERIAELTALRGDLCRHRRALGVSRNVPVSKASRLCLVGPNTIGPRAPTTIERLDALNKFPSAGHCLYPHGHPSGPAFHFCGDRIAAPGMPYCAPHMARCYRAAGVNEP